MERQARRGTITCAARDTLGVFGRYSEGKAVGPGTVNVAVRRLTFAGSPSRKVPTTRHAAQCSEVNYRTAHDNVFMPSAYGARAVRQFTPRR